MNITLEVKRNYGTDHIYPVCDTAARLTALTGKRTLSHNDIKTIRALGLHNHSTTATGDTMNEIYFKQMPVNSPQFISECIAMYSFDRIAHTVNQAIIDKLTSDGWTLAAAIEFIRSKAIRHGLDQTLGELLEKAAQDWLKQEAAAYRADCHQWAEEAAL